MYLFCLVNESKGADGHDVLKFLKEPVRASEKVGNGKK